LLRRILTTAASKFDMTVGTAMLIRGERSRAALGPEMLGHAERIELLAGIRAIYDRPEHFDDGSTFFPEPAPIEPRVTPVRTVGEGVGTVVDVTWPSTFEPLLGDIREEYLSHEPNRTAAARMWLHGDRARPAAILIHGYRCGMYRLEERVWPIPWLFERGLDVGLFVLPFHAIRAGRNTPLFPSSDPRLTNEGFRQTIHDLRALAGWLRGRGAEAVGLMGMSLGGYVTGLVATVDPRFDFAAPLIPCASIADVARSVGLLVGTPEEQVLQHEALEAVHRVVSPLARPARIAAERMVVIGAESDMITPIAHAERIARHLGAPLLKFHGGHLLQFGRNEAFRAVGRMLERIGVLMAR
jgi:hypothetical protein